MNKIICSKGYIENKIKSILKTEFLEIIDQSSSHSDHYPLMEGNISHLKIRIKSEELNPLEKIKSNQKIYSIFNDEIRSGAIHAIQIEIL
jgi:BolA protein